MKNLPYKSRFVVTQTYLNKSDRYSSGYHLGIDLVGIEDKAIYAVQDGTVIVAGNYSGYGNTVVVHQIDGLYCRYSHLEKIIVKDKQSVTSGITQIGIEGKTGNVVGTDPRHLEIKISKVSTHTDQIDLLINPADYLGIPNIKNFIVSKGSVNMAKIKNVIVCRSEIDRRAASYLADYLRCKIIEPDLLPKAVLDELFQDVYVIGSDQKPVDKAINIYGSDRYETCEKVIRFIKDNSVAVK